MTPRLDPIKVPLKHAERNRQGNWILHIDCPYEDGREHRHGGGGDGPEPGCWGTRVPHCTGIFRGKQRIDQGALHTLPAIDIRPADEDVDWDAERQRAQELLRLAVGRVEQEKADRRQEIRDDLTRSVKEAEDAAREQRLMRLFGPQKG